MPLPRSREFGIGNRRPAATSAKLIQIQQVSALPATSAANSGNISFDVFACVPSFAGDTGSTTVATAVENLKGVKPYLEVNPDVASLFENYSHGFVRYAKLELYAYPQPVAPSDGSVVPPFRRDATTGEDTGEIYNPEADVFVTCSNTLMAHGTNDAAISANVAAGTLRRKYNTQVASTRGNAGAPSVGAHLQSTYKPRDLFQVKDLLDNLEDYSFTTGNLAGTNPTTTYTGTNKPAWTVTIVPKCRTPQNEDNLVLGRVLPHRLTMRIVWDVVFYSDNPGNIENAPIGADDTFQPPSSFGDAFSDLRDVGSMLRGAKRLRDDGDL